MHFGAKTICCAYFAAMRMRKFMRLCNAIHKLCAALFQKLQFIVGPSAQHEQTNCQSNAFDIAASELLYMLIQVLFAIKWK